MSSALLRAALGSELEACVAAAGGRREHVHRPVATLVARHCIVTPIEVHYCICLVTIRSSRGSKCYHTIDHISSVAQRWWTGERFRTLHEGFKVIQKKALMMCKGAATLNVCSAELPHCTLFVRVAL
jgi:hypothetical protein